MSPFRYGFLSLLLLFFLPVTATALEIHVNKAAEITDDSITLADVAVLSPSSPRTEMLGSLVIFPGPAPGEFVTLKTSDIKRYLAHKNVDAESATWGGARTVTVKRASTTIGPQYIQRILADFITAKQDLLPQAEIRIKEVANIRPFQLPTGALDTEVIPADPSIIDSKRFSIIFRVNGKVEKNITVRAEIEALAMIAVAVNDLKRGSILSNRDIRLARMDITEVRNPCFELDELLGKKLKRSTRHGQSIDRSRVEFPPLIRRGELVTIVVSKGALTVTAKGIARHDGIKDELIKVVNNNSQKEIIGRVTGPGLITVEL